MLGLALAFPNAYYWASIHFDIPEITLLHVSALFVMLGIGADDIFLMIDSFDHTKIVFSNDGGEKRDERQVLRERMKAAYRKAGR